MERKGQDLASSMKERCFCWNVFALLIPGPLATRKLVPFAYVALDPKWRPNFDPLGVEPRRWRFKTTGFRMFSLLKYAKINLICWEFYSTNLGILNGGTEILRKKSVCFL